MASCVQSQQVQKEDQLVLPQSRIELRVRLRILEKLLYAIKDPIIKLRGILAEVLQLSAVREVLNSPRNSARAEHGQNVMTSPAPCMPAPVEDAVKVDRVELPSSRYRRYIFVQARDQGDVAGAGFGRDTSVRHAESAMFQDSRT